MASNVTLLSMRTQARQRSDQENSQFVSDLELNGYINSSIRELYDLLVQKSEDYYFTSDTILTDGIADTYPLPNDFYKLLGIDYTVDGSTSSMNKYNFQERNYYQDSNAVTVRYKILGNNLKFIPTPSAQTMTLYYIPAFSELINDSDTFDGINGWEEYVVIDAAIKCLAKEESDVSVLAAQKNSIITRINSVKERDSGRSDRVIDIRKTGRSRRWLGSDGY